jgi:long-chain acyl-CoA synthetase
VSSQRNQRENLASIVADFRRYGNQTAVVIRQGLRRRTVSYSELATLAGRFASELSQLGIVKGDRVLIWGPNSPEWIAAFFGCVLRGAVPVPLDNAGSLDFARRVQQDVAAKLIVGSAAHLDELGALAPRRRLENLATTLPPQPDFSEPEGLSDSDPLQIVFTSGTTGDPKGVVHTHRNVLASLRPIEREAQKYLKYERFFHPIRILHTLPLSHVFGQFMGLWIPQVIAAEVHFEDRLIGSELVERIRDERISVLAAVPRVLDLLRDSLRQRFPDLEERRKKMQGARAWKRWWVFRDVHKLLGFKFWAPVSGGAALPSDLEDFWDSLGFVVIQGYGMTETTALVSLNHPFHAARGSLGKVLPGREIKLTEEGEVLVRGETVSNSVWQGGKLQRRESEWLPTGDLAELDESGNLRYRGRKKDVIVTAAGLNIHPDDLEAMLMRQPEVKASAVVETQGQYGPEPLAVVVLRHGDAAAAVNRANQQLADFQQMRHWMVWPEPDLPRTSTGKVLRREVARVVAGAQRGPQQAAGSLAQLLQRVTGKAADVSDEAALTEDLNLDSLMRVELQAGLEEKFGIAVDDAAMQNVRTVGDLRKLVTAAPEAKISETAAAPVQDEHIYPAWPWNALVQFCRSAFIEVVLRPLVWLFGAPKISSHLHALPDGPVLIYANHVTAVDVALMLYALPGKLRRRVAVAMSGEILLAWRSGRYYNYRILNWISPLEYVLVTALFNVFPLPQHSGFRRSFAHAAKAMDHGYNIVVFPEGRRAGNEEIQPFMSGSGLLWSDLRCPALPVYLGGLGRLKQTREHWFHSSKMSIQVGSLTAPRPDLDAGSATALLEQTLRLLAENAGKSSPIE